MILALLAGCAAPDMTGAAVTGAAVAGIPAGGEASLTAMAGALATWIVVILVLAAVAEKIGDLLKVFAPFRYENETIARLFHFATYADLLDKSPGVLASVLRTMEATGPVVLPGGYSRAELKTLLEQVVAQPLEATAPTRITDLERLTFAAAATPVGMPVAGMQGVGIADTRSLLMWVIAATDTRRRRSESFRVLRIRGVSMLIAIVLATACGLDSLQMLRPLYEHGGGASLISAWGAGTIPSRVVGVLLTGIAAGAGTPFWHGLLDRLSQSKSKVDALKGSGEPLS